MIKTIKNTIFTIINIISLFRNVSSKVENTRLFSSIENNSSDNKDLVKHTSDTSRVEDNLREKDNVEDNHREKSDLEDNPSNRSIVENYKQFNGDYTSKFMKHLLDTLYSNYEYEEAKNNFFCYNYTT